GTGGKVTTHFSLPVANNGPSMGMDMVLIPGMNPLDPNAGKVVVVAQFSQGPVVVARYNTNGSLDKSFGGSGTGSVTISNLGSSDQGTTPSVAVQSDDRIVVAGVGSAGPNTGPDIALARLNPNGTPDAAFGLGGIVVTALPTVENPTAVVIQTDGRIVVGGTQYDGFVRSFLVARDNPAPRRPGTSFPTTPA